MTDVQAFIESLLEADNSAAARKFDLDQIQLASIVSDGIGPRVTSIELTAAQAKQGMVGADMSSAFADLLLEMYAALASGRMRCTQPRSEATSDHAVDLRAGGAQAGGGGSARPVNGSEACAAIEVKWRQSSAAHFAEDAARRASLLT